MIVNEHISNARRSAPFHACIPVPKIGRALFHRFPDHLETAHDRILKDGRRVEGLSSLLGTCFNPPDALSDMLKVQFIRLIGTH